MNDDVTFTDDGQFLVKHGRRWRREDPHLPPDVATTLRSYLGRARSAVSAARKEAEATGDDAGLRAVRHRVGVAKQGLGERGTAWWEQSEDERERRWSDALSELRELDPDR